MIIKDYNMNLKKVLLTLTLICKQTFVAETVWHIMSLRRIIVGTLSRLRVRVLGLGFRVRVISILLEYRYDTTE